MERPVKRIVLGGAAPTRSEPREPSSAASGRDRGASLAHVGWLVPPLMLAAIACALLLVVRGPDLLFGLALAVLIGIGFVWMLVSVLWPGRADRGCPSCGADALVRIDPRATSGVRCAACGFRDEHQSAWLLAEEEGPLERTVLRERALRRGRKASRSASTEELPR
ncbi:MAG TPA: hypothetical protein VNE71_06245 [Myxococcota bacterium]|nr:hypothetical protein [Myxococcota bacterium]